MYAQRSLWQLPARWQKYRSYGGKISLFSLLRAAYSSHIAQGGTRWVLREPGSGWNTCPEMGNFPFDILGLNVGRKDTVSIPHGAALVEGLEMKGRGKLSRKAALPVCF